MGFLAKLFGKQESINLELSEVREFIEKERAKNSALNREVPEIFAEIKYCIKEIRMLLEELEKEELAVENERFRKAALTSKNSFIKRVLLILQRLEPPFDANAQGIANYCYESKVLLQKHVLASRKSIAYASTALPETMHAIGKLMQSIDNSLEKLRRVINANPIVFSSMIEKLANELGEKEHYAKTIEEKIKAIESEKNLLEEKHSEESAKLKMLKSSNEAKKLAELKTKEAKLLDKKEKLKEQAIASLATLRRPLKKLKNACDRSLYNIDFEAYKSLEKLISDPWVLLKADPKGVKIKAILNELKKAIDTNKIALKDREKRQSIKTIENILSMDFFNELFWPLNEIEAKINKVQRELKALDISEKMHKLELEVSRLERKLKEKEQEKEHYTKELEKAKQALEATAENLAELLSKTLDKDIKIITKKKGMVQA